MEEMPKEIEAWFIDKLFEVSKMIEEAGDDVTGLERAVDFADWAVRQMQELGQHWCDGDRIMRLLDDKREEEGLERIYDVPDLRH